MLTGFSTLARSSLRQSPQRRHAHHGHAGPHLHAGQRRLVAHQRAAVGASGVKVITMDLKLISSASGRAL
jgi:hypothetical protein